MQDTNFSKIAEQLLLFITDTIEITDIEGMIDIDLHGDILNLTTNQGVFVLNKHSAAKEIWLASPISGPYHFANSDEGWQTKSGIKLLDILTKELNIDFNSNAN